jgi:sarcosine oxidase/L-pipecolate oxidase
MVKAGKVVVTCGAYTNTILKPLNFELKLDIWEMVYGYYSIPASRPDGKPHGMFPSMWFHFAEDSPENGRSNLFYGFPPVPWGPPDMARIAVDAATRKIGDPANRQPGSSEEDLRTAQVCATMT